MKAAYAAVLIAISTIQLCQPRALAAPPCAMRIETQATALKALTSSFLTPIVFLPENALRLPQTAADELQARADQLTRTHMTWITASASLEDAHNITIANFSRDTIQALHELDAQHLKALSQRLQVPDYRLRLEQSRVILIGRGREERFNYGAYMREGGHIVEVQTLSTNARGPLLYIDDGVDRGQGTEGQWHEMPSRTVLLAKAGSSQFTLPPDKISRVQLVRFYTFVSAP